MGRYADRFLQRGFFGLFGDVSRNGDSVGPEGISAALFAELVPRVSRCEIAAGAVGRCGPRVACAVCEAFASANYGSAAGACSAWPGASLGFGYQWRSRSRDAAIARVSAYAAVRGARVQRGHTREKTASGAAAAGSAAASFGAIGVRVRGGFAGGFGNGEERGCACDRSARAISNREAIARGATGILARIDPGIAGSSE